MRKDRHSGDRDEIGKGQQGTGEEAIWSDGRQGGCSNVSEDVLENEEYRLAAERLLAEQAGRGSE